jgi:hypothetical protein
MARCFLLLFHRSIWNHQPYTQYPSTLWTAHGPGLHWAAHIKNQPAAAWAQCFTFISTDAEISLSLWSWSLPVHLCQGDWPWLHWTLNSAYTGATTIAVIISGGLWFKASHWQIDHKALSSKTVSKMAGWVAQVIRSLASSLVSLVIFQIPCNSIWIFRWAFWFYP